MYLPQQLDVLKPLKQWVCYQNEWNEQKRKYNKRPKNPTTGHDAKANDSATWATYDEAVTAAQRFGFDGVGFEFAAGYMGIDLDNVIDASGGLSVIATEIVETMDSYTEYSPSGKGLHILCKCSGAKPVGSRNDAIGLEMYNHGRFFTVTGKPYGVAKPIHERLEQARAVFMKYLYKPKAQSVGSKSPYTPVGSQEGSDADLWQKMFDNSAKGREIRALYNGDISGHDNDHSRADQALANHLAYWTNCDGSRVDRMFRQSGLMRPKWDESRGAQTYGAMTIAEAIARTPVYVPPYVPPVKATAMVYDSRTTAHENFAGRGTGKMPKEAQSKRRLPGTIGQYIMSGLVDELTRFQGFKDCKTGFSNIDAKMGFYPGLYVLGAISSLGKTAFSLQLADQLARAGEHVLFFSFEQTRFEMVTRGLSRITAQQSERDGFKTAVSAINIRRGEMTGAVKDAMKTYADFAEHEAVIECSFKTTIGEIIETVKEYIAQTGVKPVVFVDYLQVIQPADPKQSAKEAVDGYMKALKEFQKSNELVLVIVSSLNRQNYLTPIDFESFKESGSVEFTADVIWGLQLQAMNDALFDKNEQVKKKRDMVKAAKRENPRRIEFVCLKNRNGDPNFSCGFKYYAAFDYFVPMSQAEFERSTGTDSALNGKTGSQARV